MTGAGPFLEVSGFTQQSCPDNSVNLLRGTGPGSEYTEHSSAQRKNKVTLFYQ